MRGLDQQRTDFVQKEVPALRDSQETWIAGNSGQLAPGRLRVAAFDEARRLAEQATSTWLVSVEPHVIALYESATKRFVELTNEFVTRVTADTEPISVEPLDASDVREYERPHFYFASLMHLTAGTPVKWLIDRFGPRTVRERRVSRQVSACLETMAAEEVNGRLEQLASIRNELRALERQRLLLLTGVTKRRKFDLPRVAISRHPSTSVHDHVEHASSSSPPRHSEKHPQHRDGW